MTDLTHVANKAIEAFAGALEISKSVNNEEHYEFWRFVNELVCLYGLYRSAPMDPVSRKQRDRDIEDAKQMLDDWRAMRSTLTD